MVQFGNDWDEILSGEFEKTYYKQLRTFLKKNIPPAVFTRICTVFLKQCR